MDRTEMPARPPRAPIPHSETGASRLERSVADTLRAIAAVRRERDEAPVRDARKHLAEIYGATRLIRHRERARASA